MLSFQRVFLINTAGGFVCDCEKGFSLTKNSTCADIDECQKNPCQPEETCTNTVGSYECEYEGSGVYCTKGFMVLDDECIDVDECQIKNGGCDQGCVNTNGSFKCTCKNGYLLDRKNLKKCKDIDECKSKKNVCPEKGQVCKNQPGSFICETCGSGYNMVFIKNSYYLIKIEPKTDNF